MKTKILVNCLLISIFFKNLKGMTDEEFVKGRAGFIIKTYKFHHQCLAQAVGTPDPNNPLTKPHAELLNFIQRTANIQTGTDLKKRTDAFKIFS